MGQGEGTKEKDRKETERGGTSHISALYVGVLGHTEGAPQAGMKDLDRP